MKMKNKKTSVHIIFASVELVLALVTLMPRAAASKVSFLGYKALCSFSPISTIGLLALVGLHIFLHKRAAGKVSSQ
jgi:hypothetical protein